MSGLLSEALDFVENGSHAAPPLAALNGLHSVVTNIVTDIVTDIATETVTGVVRRMMASSSR